MWFGGFIYRGCVIFLGMFSCLGDTWRGERSRVKVLLGVFEGGKG